MIINVRVWLTNMVLFKKIYFIKILTVISLKQMSIERTKNKYNNCHFVSQKQ